MTWHNNFHYFHSMPFRACNIAISKNSIYSEWDACRTMREQSQFALFIEMIHMWCSIQVTKRNRFNSFSRIKLCYENNSYRDILNKSLEFIINMIKAIIFYMLCVCGPKNRFFFFSFHCENKLVFRHFKLFLFRVSVSLSLIWWNSHKFKRSLVAFEARELVYFFLAIKFTSVVSNVCLWIYLHRKLKSSYTHFRQSTVAFFF